MPISAETLLAVGMILMKDDDMSLYEIVYGSNGVWYFREGEKNQNGAWVFPKNKTAVSEPFEVLRWQYSIWRQ